MATARRVMYFHDGRHSNLYQFEPPWKDKHYLVPTEIERSPNKECYFGYVRPLPAELSVGSSVTAPLSVADDLALAASHGRVHSVLLRVRVMQASPDDRYRVVLNGADVPDGLCRRIDVTYRMDEVRFRAGSCFWLDYQLDPAHYPVPGANSVEVKLLRRDQRVLPEPTVRDVELEVKYTEGRHAPRLDERHRI